MAFPLDHAAPASLDLDPKALERLHETITRHIVEGRYPGAQYAVARHGKLAVLSTIGEARTDPSRWQWSSAFGRRVSRSRLGAALMRRRRPRPRPLRHDCGRSGRSPPRAPVPPAASRSLGCP